MAHIEYRGDRLHMEDVAIADVAESVGTPCYVYSHGRVAANIRRFENAFDRIDHLTCYSVKANSNLAVLRAAVQAGVGFDVVSGGELFRAIRAGADPQRIVFSGAGKTADEIDTALERGILMLNAESRAELELIDRIAAARGVRARVSLRINPDVDPDTHPYVTTGLRKNKFGIDDAEAMDVYAWAASRPALDVSGLDCHIGSNIKTLEPFAEAMLRMREFILRLRERGVVIHHCDVGGGFAISYDGSPLPSLEEYAKTVVESLDPEGLGVKLLLEPGRVLVGDAGILVCRVLYLKRHGDRNFVIVDGAMNDFMRPCLYQAHHEVRPVLRRDADVITADVVGPVCETSDFFALDREMSAPEPGDLISIMDAGAYGFGLASNFNSRGRAAEVMVHGGDFAIVRERESFDDLVAGESVPAFLG